MTVGDIIEKTRLAFGGVTKDEQELHKLKEGLRSLHDLRSDERKKKGAIDSLIKDKQAELKVTTLKQNQISIAKEVMKLKEMLNEVQKTEDEITGKIDVLDALINEKEREINAKASAAAGATVDKIEIATDKRKDRVADNEDLNKAMSGLVEADGSSAESSEDIDALLAAAMSDDAAPVKKTLVESEEQSDEAIIAAANAETSAPTCAEVAPNHGVAVPN